jgi:hypothetical protein
MGQRGPSPTPTRLLQLRGSWRAKQRPNELRPRRTRPRPPATLGAEAKKGFLSLVRQLYAQHVVVGLDAQSLARYADLRLRGVQRDAFLVEDPRDPLRELVALEPAVGDGARVTFSLPTAEASPDFRWYPKQGTVVGYVNGVGTAVVSVGTDARTITFAAAPGVGATVKGTYRGLRLVRLSDPPSFQGVTKRFGQYELALEEVLRD